MRFRVRFGPWKTRELAVAMDRTPQFINGRIRGQKIDALSAGLSKLISHATVAASLGMSVEDAEAAWPDCCAEAERLAALEAAKDKRNRPMTQQTQPKPKARSPRSRTRPRGEIRQLPA